MRWICDFCNEEAEYAVEELDGTVWYVCEEHLGEVEGGR